MNTILAYDVLQIVKPMSINDKPRIEQWIFEVENYDLCMLIGRDVYMALLEDSQLEDINKPIYFQNIFNNGLKQCIAFLVYSKYCREGYLQDTFSGMKTKISEYSNQAANGDMKNIAREYKEQASYWLDQVRNQIDEQYKNQGCHTPESRPASSEMFTIYGKRNNIRNRYNNEFIL